MTDEERYRAACHAMQTGVKTEMGLPGREHATDPKDLRVGINSAMCDHAAIARLLIAKGVITQAEFMKELADEMEREVDRYRVSIAEQMGVDPSRITLA
jgi:hypothetical protein